LKGYITTKLTSGEETALLNVLLKETQEVREDEVEDVSSYQMAVTKKRK